MTNNPTLAESWGSYISNGGDYQFWGASSGKFFYQLITQPQLTALGAETRPGMYVGESGMALNPGQSGSVTLGEPGLAWQDVYVSGTHSHIEGLTLQSVTSTNANANKLSSNTLKVSGIGGIGSYGGYAAKAVFAAPTEGTWTSIYSNDTADQTTAAAEGWGNYVGNGGDFQFWAASSGQFMYQLITPAQIVEQGFTGRAGMFVGIDGSTLSPGMPDSVSLGQPDLAWEDIYTSGTLFSVDLQSTGSNIQVPGIGAPALNSEVVCWSPADGKLTHQTANCSLSSIRFKEHIKALTSSELMDRARKLRAVQYDLKPGMGYGPMGTPTEEGFIAEEVAKIDSYLVIWEKKDKQLIPRSVDYARVSVVLSGAIQNLDERLIKIEKKVK
jgi:hypothetical protein